MSPKVPTVVEPVRASAARLISATRTSVNPSLVWLSRLSTTVT
jgi:hypothetical protein